ncbi:hypothetical protein IWZ00DRAFT_260880 [Phyllosticta capitalensis]|uniref:uncharacterized protein n=1 Tax=Phyllosticta capitalensis TaxID=121624 RepID=UPI003130F471
MVERSDRRFLKRQFVMWVNVGAVLAAIASRAKTFHVEGENSSLVSTAYPRSPPVRSAFASVLECRGSCRLRRMEKSNVSKD